MEDSRRISRDSWRIYGGFWEALVLGVTVECGFGGAWKIREKRETCEVCEIATLLIFEGL
jgi:hypothetical protein